jgi:hypothetical protein
MSNTFVLPAVRVADCGAALADRPTHDITLASGRYLAGWAGPISGVRTGLAMP